MILALDLGTKTGVCVMNRSGIPIFSGTWDLSRYAKERWGARFNEFRYKLECALNSYKIDLIAYEDVHRHLATDAAHIYGGLLALVEMTALTWDMPTSPIGVGIIKKAATGRGNADKTAMAVRASRRWPDLDIKDDNQADALWIAEACRTGAVPAPKKPRKKETR